jgi:hypothetical protein
MEVVLSRRAPGHPKKFEFVEREAEWSEEEPGFKRFLRDRVLSGDAPRGRNCVPEETEVQRKAAHSAVLLSGITEPQRPSSFS